MSASNSTDRTNVTMAHADSRSKGLARNWWAIAIRAVLAAGLAIGIFWGSTYTLATLVLLFAAYVAADGVAAIVAGLLRMKRGEFWQTLIFEGTLNLFFAGAILVWPAIVATAFVGLASIWAVVTGAALLAAARRTCEAYVQGLLALAGLVSIVWGLLMASIGPTSDSAPDTVGWWLIGYALSFAAALLMLSCVLQRQYNQSAWCSE
jgi:uncharacterized membrane protein HdeD (DUF308 family)